MGAMTTQPQAGHCITFRSQGAAKPGSHVPLCSAEETFQCLVSRAGMGTLGPHVQGSCCLLHARHLGRGSVWQGQAGWPHSLAGAAHGLCALVHRGAVSRQSSPCDLCAYLLGTQWTLTCAQERLTGAQAWWRTPAIPAFGRLKQEDRCELQASLGCSRRRCLSVELCVIGEKSPRGGKAVSRKCCMARPLSCTAVPMHAKHNCR